jgi:hypothetical protein
MIQLGQDVIALSCSSNMDARYTDIISFHHQHYLLFGVVNDFPGNGMLIMTVWIRNKWPVVPDIPDDVNQMMWTKPKHGSFIFPVPPLQQLIFTFIVSGIGKINSAPEHIQQTPVLGTTRQYVRAVVQFFGIFAFQVADFPYTDSPKVIGDGFTNARYLPEAF